MMTMVVMMKQAVGEREWAEIEEYEMTLSFDLLHAC